MKTMCSLGYRPAMLLAFCTIAFIFSSIEEASAQAWTSYQSEYFNIQFQLPSNWKTRVDTNEDILVSEGNGIVFVLTAVKDESISTFDLFEIQLNNLEMETEGEYEEIELEGGIHAYLGSGVGMIDGEFGALILVAATLDENNYLAYIYCSPDSFDENEDTMVDIITSLEPLGY